MYCSIASKPVDNIGITTTLVPISTIGGKTTNLFFDEVII